MKPVISTSWVCGSTFHGFFCPVVFCDVGLGPSFLGWKDQLPRLSIWGPTGPQAHAFGLEHTDPLSFCYRWWLLNQPTWKICVSQIGSLSPRIRVKIKNTWNHQPVLVWSMENTSVSLIQSGPKSWTLTTVNMSIGVIVTCYIYIYVRFFSHLLEIQNQFDLNPIF